MMAVFLSYVIYIVIKFGILPSISQSFYELSQKNNFLFTFFCWGFALPAIIIGTDLTNNFLMFLAGSGIMFVGAAAAFKEKLTKPVHEISAYAGVILSQLSIAYDFNMYYINFIFIGLSLIIAVGLKRTRTFWIEILAFLSICYVLWSNLF